MKAVDHAVEQLCHPTRAPFADALAVDGLKRLAAGLLATQADPASLDARLECQFGMWLAISGVGSGRGMGPSHALGHTLGENLAPLDLSPAELAALEQGMQDAVAGTTPKVPVDEYEEKVAALATKRSEKLAAEGKARDAEFLTKMAAHEGAQKFDSGLIYIEREAGKGESPKAAPCTTATPSSSSKAVAKSSSLPIFLPPRVVLPITPAQDG